jgi:hypothetical protein
VRGWLVAGVTAGVAAAFALAGCSGDDGGTGSTRPATTDTGTTDAEATATAVAGSPERFVTVVRHQVPDVATGRTDAELAAVAAAACEGLAIGLPADRVTADVRSLGTLDAAATDQATARELVKLAIDAVCPDQAGRVDEF